MVREKGSFGTYLTVPVRTQIRRSSSLQLPLNANKVENGGLRTCEFNSKDKSSSSLSICASSLSMAMMGHSNSAINLYTLMARYRCCCGMCRLRIASLVVAFICMSISVLVLSAYWNYKETLSAEQRKMLSVPVFIVALYQIIASISLLTGLFTESHWLLIPFHISCVVCMMSAMAIGMILLVSADRKLTQLYPIFAALSMALVAVYLWFLVISCMSFVLLRDKKRLLSCDIDFMGSASTGTLLERVNSSHF
ncbi:hypothetical protein Tcan_17812 [Toxocara canis]|uniref:Uncharacterized protein n=1 Tax=Toxocara canis TaxID=6265 RepID=A0A0B2VXI7_TOXCA|nr:hypothetical protein Tcan_17812 [Toxocara canis]